MSKCICENKLWYVLTSFIPKYCRVSGNASLKYVFPLIKKYMWLGVILLKRYIAWVQLKQY